MTERERELYRRGWLKGAHEALDPDPTQPIWVDNTPWDEQSSTVYQAGRLAGHMAAKSARAKLARGKLPSIPRKGLT